MVKVLYTLFLAIMIALFIGLGIDTFFSIGKYPDYPVELQTVKTDDLSVEQKQIQTDYDQRVKEYNSQHEKYSRNTSIIATIASIVLLVLSLTLLSKIEVINDGVMLGGVLTLGYGIIQGFMSNDNKIRFIAVSVGLIIAFILGYVKYIRSPRTKEHL